MHSIATATSETSRLCIHTMDLKVRQRTAVQGVDAQLVVDEVEVDTEDRVAVDLAHGPGWWCRGR